MFDDLDALFYENVVGAYTEYPAAKKSGVFGQSKDLRAGLQAATALYHFREHISEAHHRSRKDIAKQCPDYDLLGDIVNAVKHREVTRGTPRVTSADSLEQQMVITEYRDDQGEYRYAEKVVVVKLDDGSTRDLHEVLTNVINFWMMELERIGVSNSRKPFLQPIQNLARTRAECTGTSMDIEMVKGLRFNAVYRLLRYNYEAGIAEPIDLTGSKIQMTLRKPPAYEIDLHVRHDKTGEEVSRKIKLTDEESLEYYKLETDEQRAAFAQRIPRLRDEFMHMVREARSRKWQGRFWLLLHDLRSAWQDFLHRGILVIKSAGRPRP